MDTEVFKLLLESLSGIAILGLGFWFVIARMRNGHTDVAEKYVTRHAFNEAVNASRKQADRRHDAEVKAIQDVGREFREAINQTNQNHLEHVQHGHDD